MWPGRGRCQPVKIIPSSSLIIVQNLVTASQTVCAHIGRSKIGDAWPRPLGHGRG